MCTHCAVPGDEGGNLQLNDADVATKERVMSVIEETQNTPNYGSIVENLVRLGMNQIPPPMNESSDKSRLQVFYTDCEPDDLMALAQLWQIKVEYGELSQKPVIIGCVDFATKDGGTVLEKKHMLRHLLLGNVEWDDLTFEGDVGQSKSFANTVHPKTGLLAEKRNEVISKICEKITQFNGDLIELYFMSPGHGNLGAILSHLHEQKQWPLKAKWTIKMYTGSFNTRGCTDSDIEALKAIMKCSNEPLVDMSRFPFFGKENCLPETVSLATFCLPSFAQKINDEWPVLAATWRVFNTEFNQGLIHPDNTALFKGNTPTSEESKRFAGYKEVFLRDGVEAYSKLLRDDAGLWSKVVDYKKSTVISFAYGKCDGPLCDQLLFIYEWIVRKQASWLDPDSMIEGEWILDKKSGFTSIGPKSPDGIRGIQPVLGSPSEKGNIDIMRMITESYILRHLKSISKEPDVPTDTSLPGGKMPAMTVGARAGLWCTFEHSRSIITAMTFATILLLACILTPTAMRRSEM